MPAAVVVPAAITAIGTLGSAALQSRANNRASDAQERAAQQALAFERERETSRKSEYDRAMSDYRRQWDAWNQQRMGLMRRYGMNVPAGGGGRMTLGAMAGGETPEDNPLVPKSRQPMSLGELGWS